MSKIGKRVFVGYGRGISLILWLCVVSYANAQLLTIESEATITIEDNALLHSEGIVENFGTLNNNGTLSLSQDFVNLRSYNPGTGTITLLGDNQTINLINDIQIQGIIYNLTVEGEGSHVLPGYIQVDNRLTLNSGILTVTGEDTLYLGPDAEISGGSENSFVEGHLIYAGNGYRFFPVGKDGVYNPIELLDVQGVNTTLLVEAFMPNEDTLVEDVLFKVNQSRYWRISTYEGSFLGSVAQLPVFDADGYIENEFSGLVVASKPFGDSIYYDRGRFEAQGDHTGGFVSSMDSVYEGDVTLALTKEFVVNGKVAFPNAFSPNAIDVLNQQFVILGNDVRDEPFILRIYDRNGALVYETTSFAEANETGWDGYHYQTGKALPGGVYSFTMTLEYLDRRVESHTGSINLYW